MRAKNEQEQLSEAYQNVLREGEEKPDPLDDHSSVEAYRAARGIPMPSDEEEPQPGDYGSIEDLFTQRVWYIGDRGDTFEVADFEEFKPYILNWDTLLEIMDEENTEGFSERWEEVKFGNRSEDNELDHFLTKEQPEDFIPSTDYEDVLNDLVNKDKKEHALKKLNGDGERHRHSPMLDSYQTSTAGYLTEQAASDKRNKKSEAKSQSFKDKYKPKTHSQLEELRRYGL